MNAPSASADSPLRAKLMALPDIGRLSTEETIQLAIICMNELTISQRIEVLADCLDADERAEVCAHLQGED